MIISCIKLMKNIFFFIFEIVFYTQEGNCSTQGLGYTYITDVLFHDTVLAEFVNTFLQIHLFCLLMYF